MLPGTGCVVIEIPTGWGLRPDLSADDLAAECSEAGERNDDTPTANDAATYDHDRSHPEKDG